MPQMAPLNWLTLLFMFIAILYMFNMMNFFTFSYKPNKNFFSYKTKKINWKW